MIWKPGKELHTDKQPYYWESEDGKYTVSRTFDGDREMYLAWERRLGTSALAIPGRYRNFDKAAKAAERWKDKLDAGLVTAES